SRHRPKYWIPSAKIECAAFKVSMAVVAVMTHTLEAQINPYKVRKPNLWITRSKVTILHEARNSRNRPFLRRDLPQGRKMEQRTQVAIGWQNLGTTKQH
ncbi:hypothetical protein, partial [Corynebacterium sp. 11266D000AW]